MSNYLVTDTELTSVADAIRTKGGTSAALEFPGDFVTAIGNISGGGGSTLGTKTITANDTYDASDDDLDGYSQVTVSVPASAVDTGTKSISTNGTHDVTGYASASVSVPTGTARTSADLTASGATVNVPAGLYAEAASKSVASGSATTPATTITANPTIAMNTPGVITATVSATQSVSPTVSSGYVSSGTAGTITVSGTKSVQLTTKGMTYYHPSTSDQIIDLGTYLTGVQTFRAVTHNLTAGDIKKDVVVKIGDSTDDDCVTSITGTYEGGGGGYTANDWLDPTKPTGAIESDYVFSNNDYGAMLARHTGITSVTLSEATYLPSSFLARCSNLIEFKGPKIVTLWAESLRETKISTIVLPSWTTNNSSEFYGCTSLTTVDRGGAGTIGGTYTFRNCTALSTLILRSTTMVVLGGTGAFNGTPFASGGAGGTIYIPKTLYDHLGDGGSSDYKAATNWSTVEGYGTITWAKIEGSQYENYYADGTAIPST